MLPKTVMALGDDAFKGCGKVTGVEAPGLRKVGARAFKGCESLSSFESATVKDVSEEAVAGYTSLKILSLQTSAK